MKTYRFARIHVLPAYLSLVILLLGIYSECRAQVFTFKLTSVPDSAQVMLAGKPVGYTPMEAQVDWRTLPNGGCVFSFAKPGYVSQDWVVAEKPRYKENFKDIKLDKLRPHFSPDSTSGVLLDFNKVMTEFELGRVIGHNKTFYGGDITWEAYSRVGVEQFATKANDVLGSAGFRTPSIKKNELFAEEDSSKLEPRFLIGGKVTDIWVELGPTTLIGIKAKNWCNIEWKVFDKSANKVVLTKTTKGTFDGKYTNPTELNVMMDLFQDSLEQFLMGGELYQLVRVAGGQ